MGYVKAVVIQVGFGGFRLRLLGSRSALPLGLVGCGVFLVLCLLASVRFGAARIGTWDVISAFTAYGGSEDDLIAEWRDRVAPVVEASPRLAVLYAPDASTTFVFDERGAPANPHAKLGFDLVVPDGLRVPEEGFAEISSEVVSDQEADSVVVLRPTSGETPGRLPLDDLLDAPGGPGGGPRVLRQAIDPTRPSSSPIADKQAIEQAAELLLKGR